MKKIFTLIAMAAMAISANAQKFWDLATWESVDFTSEQTVDGLTYYGESKSAWASGKATFTKGESSITLTGRVKQGGQSTFKTDNYSRVFAFDAKKGQNVIVFGTHGSSSGDARTIYLSQTATGTNRDTGTAFANVALQPSEKNFVEGTVPEDGKVYVWTDNNNGIYGIAVGYTFAELAASTAGINSVKVANESNAIYNLAGQQVTEAYKGVVVKNGKKMIQK